jgi:hypothetical protein
MTSKEIEELAGHRPVSAWVIKLVGDAIAIEREECAYIADQGFRRAAEGDEIADLIRARGHNE